LRLTFCAGLVLAAPACQRATQTVAPPLDAGLTASDASDVNADDDVADGWVRFAAGTPENPERVSILTLLAAPDRYAGKNVRLMGFVNLEFEGDAIYLHR
jgi:hypothetical protein